MLSLADLAFCQYYSIPSDYALEYLQPRCYLSDVVYCRMGLGLAEENAKSRALRTLEAYS